MKQKQTVYMLKRSFLMIMCLLLPLFSRLTPWCVVQGWRSVQAALSCVLMIYPKGIFNQVQTQEYLVLMASEDTSISNMRADKSTYRQDKPIMGTAPHLYSQAWLSHSIQFQILGSAAEDVGWLFVCVKHRPWGYLCLQLSKDAFSLTKTVFFSI